VPGQPTSPGPAVWIARAGHTAQGALEAAFAAWGLIAGRPVLISVGGAANLDPALTREVKQLFASLMPILEAQDGVVIDGGTAFGVMALMGEARREAAAHIPLIGIAPQAMVRAGHADGHAGAHALAPLDPSHSHALLVPGSRWGDESPWLSAAADRLADGRPTLMLVVAGGDITLLDVKHRLRTGGAVLVLAGSGGAADRLAQWQSEGAAHGGVLPGFDPGDGTRDLLQVISLSEAPHTLPQLIARRFGA
jgi:hypothetical protein